MKILFICSANKLRSKTAEDYFSETNNKHTFLSAGTNIKTCLKEGTTPLEEYLLDWADIVYVMEKKHKQEVNNFVGDLYNNKIIILNIKDNYKYYQKELIELLENKVNLNEFTWENKGRIKRNSS